ncbi:MAG: hypothetical protein IJL05_04420 [Alphaproteobacteria bacterium]|nr:hypothetical protein [Alphaproteobacteria bacterium]
MKHQNDTICIRNVWFQEITEQTFHKINISDLQFFLISQSGVIDKPGNIYFFTSDGAFFMNQNDYKDGFINKLLSIVPEWNLVNIYFCDFLIINPKIYNSFVTQLCTTNIRDFWFETAIDIYNINQTR